MRKGLSILLVLSSASVVAFAEDPGSLAPVSAIVKSNPAGSALKITPAPTRAIVQATAAEAELLERRIAKLQEAEHNFVNWNARKSDGTFAVKVYYEDGTLIPDTKVGHRLHAVNSQLDEARKMLDKVDDFPNLMKTPGFEFQLKQLNRLSKERTSALIAGEDARNMQRSLLSNPRVQLDKGDYSHFSKVAHDEKEAVKIYDSYLARFRGNYIQPSKSALNIAQKTAVVGRSAVMKAGTSLSVVLGAGMIAGALESDRTVTAIDPGQDTGMYNELNRFSEGASEIPANPASIAESRR